jgi:hypothetical protein
MAAAIGSLTFILLAGWIINKWDKQRKKYLDRKTEVPPIDENSYS